MAKVLVSEIAAGAPVIFDHGTNANAIRPVTPLPVWWTGTVQPVNWLPTDWWLPPVAAGTPTMPAGLVGRWSALDLSALADNAAVTTWNDKVASLAMVPTGAPVKKTGDFVRFDGVDDRMDAALGLALPTTFLTLFRLPSVTTSQPILGSSGAVHSISTSSASLLQLNAGTAISRAGAVNANEWMLVSSFVKGDATSGLKKGNEARTTGNVGTNPRANVRIASNTAAAAWAQVDIKEVLIFNSILTDAQIDDVRSLLNTAHGLSI